MKICADDLATVDLERLRPFVRSGSEFFDPGQHYRLLAFLAQKFQGQPVVDLGTNYGESALALSYGGGRVDSFDIADRVGGRVQPSNIHFHIEDVFSVEGREKWRETLLSSALIFIDIDPHEGRREHEMLSWLEAEKYQGLIVLDDIWYFKEMRDNLWYLVEPRYKTDATSLGHWSGTGIVSFSEPVVVEAQIEMDLAASKWTLVTGYFDLTKKGDATPEIQARPKSHYLESHASSVLSLPNNLVVFCEPDTEAQIWAMRPDFLHSKTRVISMSFEDFPLTKFRSKIIENRGGYSCARDPRNTASYYLFCMARYAMVKQAIAFNPFGSTHFAWINICIERMGFRNLIHLPEALSLKRDRFSTCFIDYVSSETVKDLKSYFGPQGCKAGGPTCKASCTMCSGFFTGRAAFMKEVCSKIEEAFLRCLEKGYGHADEQLFPIVYYEKPELFEWYLGDYAEMITNYAGVREHPEKPLRNLIAHALQAGDREVCRKACEILWNSYADDSSLLVDAERDALLDAWKKSS